MSGSDEELSVCSASDFRFPRLHGILSMGFRWPVRNIDSSVLSSCTWDTDDFLPLESMFEKLKNKDV